MSKRLCVTCLSFCLTYLVLSSTSADALVHSYVEDFTTKQYCDTLNTTAWWDTVAGEMKLHPFELTLASNYDTHGFAFNVAVSGDYAYVAGYSSGLQVIEVFQRRFDLNSNTAWSLSVGASDETIMGARLSNTQTDSIRWEVSADSGGSWQEFLPAGDYQNFTSPGSNPIWRSTHLYTATGVNPACSHLEIEWLYRFAMIDSIVDVPGDQGRQVRIYWRRSGHDFTYGPIVDYAIYRRIDRDLTLSSESVPFENGPGLLCLYPPGDWDFVARVPASAEQGYATVVPTLADSSISGGMHYTTFFIRASTETLGIHFDSYPDSDYSLDDLAPGAPLNLMMTSAADLAWDECPDDDFNYFTVYGSAAPVLDTTAVLIGYTIEIVGDVSGGQYAYYHVTATDFAGNEGDASSVENTYAGVSGGEDLPQAFALKPNRPNPFESGTLVAFDLPEPCVVRLEVVDVQGRVVRVLTDEVWSAGRHSVVWTGENDTGGVSGPGVYFVRIQAGGFRAINKMLRMK